MFLIFSLKLIYDLQNFCYFLVCAGSVNVFLFKDIIIHLMSPPDSFWTSNIFNLVWRIIIFMLSLPVLCFCLRRGTSTHPCFQKAQKAPSYSLTGFWMCQCCVRDNFCKFSYRNFFVTFLFGKFQSFFFFNFSDFPWNWYTWTTTGNKIDWKDWWHLPICSYIIEG